MIKGTALGALALLSASSSADGATISHERLDSGTELIYIAGELKSGDDAAFKKLAIEFDKAVVVLSSDGGALVPALEIGTALHLRGFDTSVVTGQCASACALIWAAGADRTLFRGARVGFHASYVEDGGRVIETGLGNALVGRYLTQLGLPESAIVFATTSHPDSISWLSQESDGRTSGFSFKVLAANRGGDESSPVAKASVTKPAVAYTTVEGWGIYRNADDCAAVAQYKDGSLLTVHYNARRRSTNVGFSYPDGASLNEGDERTIAMYLVRPGGKLDDGWKSVKFTVSVYGGVRVLYSQDLDDPAFDDMGTTNTVGFLYRNKLVSSFKLSGLSTALAEVAKCSRIVNHVNPRDVFAQ